MSAPEARATLACLAVGRDLGTHCKARKRLGITAYVSLVSTRSDAKSIQHLHTTHRFKPDQSQLPTMPLSVEDNFKLLASYCVFNGDADKVARYMGITKNAV